MKKIITVVALVFCTMFASFVDAKGGVSGGGGRGGFSSARSFSSSGGASVSRPSASAATRTVTTTTRSSYVSPSPVMYGGMGPGFGYNNGLLTGVIIGNMMHPHNTVVYAGGGAHSNNALLYPDGKVVTQNGQQVGTYQNGTFTPVANGAIVAQPVPADAVQDTPWYVILGYLVMGIVVLILAFIFIKLIL